jgi:hypothetical protein
VKGGDSSYGKEESRQEEDHEEDNQEEVSLQVGRMRGS